MENKIVMGFWDCPFCGRKKIKGTERDCPACGNPRGTDTKFYMDSSNIEYLSDDEAKNKGQGADWLCPYCNTLNPVKETSCQGCGAAKEESDKDYFSMNKPKPPVEDKKPEPVSAKKKKSPFSWKMIGIGLMFLAVILGLVSLFTPKEKTFHCTDVSWENEIQIEAYETVEESDWELPPNAKLKHKEKEIRSYEKVLDHYDEVTKTRKVESGSHTEYTYEDNGDGTFTEVPHEVIDYKDETYTEQEPVYREEPVYDTKYYYEIKKWMNKRKVTNSGHNHSPVWGETNLLDDEREGSRSCTYYVEGWYKEGKSIKIEVPENIWNQMEKGKSYSVKTDVTGDILELITSN